MPCHFHHLLCAHAHTAGVSDSRAQARLLRYLQLIITVHTQSQAVTVSLLCSHLSRPLPQPASLSYRRRFHTGVAPRARTQALSIVGVVSDSGHRRASTAKAPAATISI
ncbi:hypothetical protein M0R45_036338 [Rubus argutus]|uniref:Uncharacterized protein n=1 Tax=Rubus argutus TaxID=59490 RepID=A0AAW1VZB7_RUBAR